MTYLEGYGLTTVASPTGTFFPPDNGTYKHLNFDSFTAQDALDYAAGLVDAAIDLAERETGVFFRQRTVAVTFGSFPAPPCGSPLRDHAIEIPVRPVRSVASLVYTNADGDEVALTGLQEWLDHKPPLVLHEADGSWPAVKAGALKPVTLTVVVGYGTVYSAMPAAVQQAVRLTIGYWFEHRGDGRDPTTWTAASVLATDMGLPMGAVRLLRNFRDVEYR